MSSNDTIMCLNCGHENSLKSETCVICKAWIIDYESMPDEENSREKITEIENKMDEEKKARGGASWFFWIAGLSLINAIILFSGGNIRFLAGLGLTSIVDIYASQFSFMIGKLPLYTAFGFDLIAAFGFAILGYQASRGKAKAFVIGMLIYGIDGLFFLPFRDYLSFGFHIFALFWIHRGYRAMKKVNLQNQLISDANINL